MGFIWPLMMTFSVLSIGTAVDEYPPGVYYNLSLPRNIVCSPMATLNTDGCNARFGQKVINHTYPWFIGDARNMHCAIFNGDDEWEFFTASGQPEKNIPPGAVVRCNLDGLVNQTTSGSHPSYGLVRLNLFNTDIDGYLAVIQHGGPAPRN